MGLGGRFFIFVHFGGLGFGFFGGKNVEGLSIVKGSKYPQYKVF